MTKFAEAAKEHFKTHKITRQMGQRQKRATFSKTKLLVELTIGLAMTCKINNTEWTEKTAPCKQAHCEGAIQHQDFHQRLQKFQTLVCLYVWLFLKTAIYCRSKTAFGNYS